MRSNTMSVSRHPARMVDFVCHVRVAGNVIVGRDLLAKNAL